MTIKTRSALAIVGVSSIILILFSLVMYASLLAFEKKQFNERLYQKAANTVRLLEDVKEIDSLLLSIIDANTVQELRQEKLLILAKNNQVLYSSIDEHIIQYSQALLQRIRQHKLVYFQDGEYDAVGLLYGTGSRERIVLFAAYDETRSKAIAVMLKVLLIGNVIILGVLLVTAYFVADRALEPLSLLNHQIAAVSDASLHQQQLAVPVSKDEIQQLAASFNQMLQRLQAAFDQQQSFIRHASHELRTPLAAVTAQIDVALNQDLSPADYKAVLLSLQEDHDRLSQLVNQLLLLFKAEREEALQHCEDVAMHALLEEVQEEVNTLYPLQMWHNHFDPFPAQESDLVVYGNKSLLHSCLSNLLTNAAKYGTGNQVHVELSFSAEAVTISVINEGAAIPIEEREKLFQPFYRSRNAQQQKGIGLGLLLVKKVAYLHGGSIRYQSDGPQNNRFILSITKYKQTPNSVS